jgi:hemerythrin-like domain-containing protein
MRTQSDRPADTRIMGIVHDALRRDLSRATAALESTRPPAGQQRMAIAAHVRWLMDFLHVHHAGEDQGLWPLVRAHNPAAGDLLDQMDADHARIGPQFDQVQNAAATYGADASPAARQGLASAIELLRSVLDPHLRREEDEMMPVVSRSITHAQWEAFNNTTYVQPKSKKNLGHEGHWLIDSLDPERYDVVVHTVPALPRFILIHAMAGPYRRGCAARWGPDVQVRPLRQQLPAMGEGDPDLLDGRYRRRGQVSLHIDASQQDLYDVVADVTRIGERSPECHTARWLPGPPQHAVGARFRGYNKKGLIRWSRKCEVITADPGHAFAYRTIPERVDLSRRDSTTWTYLFTPEAIGTRVTHSYDVTLPPLRAFIALYRRVMPQHSDMRPAMTDNLTALKQIAEHEHAAPRLTSTT